MSQPEIQELVARYADAVNRRDADAWGATWADDGEWTILGATKRGRADVVAHWQLLMSHIPSVLQIPSFGLVSGDPPSGRWYVQEFSQRPDGSGLTLGVYHDRYVLEEGQWRFASRRFDILYSGAPDLSAAFSAFPEDAPDV